jgi:hypothetical protein
VDALDTVVLMLTVDVVVVCVRLRLFVGLQQGALCLASICHF